MRALRGGGSPRAALVSTFEWATDAAAARQRGQSLLVNAALESRTFAPEMAQALQGVLLGMELNFRVERARSANDVAANVDPVQTARALLGLYLGLCTLVRSDAKEPVLRAVVQQALSPGCKGYGI